MIEHTASELKRVGRLKEADLSPHWKVRDQPAPPPDPRLPLWAKIGAGASVVVVILIYLVLSIVHFLHVQNEMDQLLK